MLAGTKPSKVAARLSLVDWLLVVLVDAVASVFSSTVATSIDAMVADEGCCNPLVLEIGMQEEHQRHRRGRERPCFAAMSLPRRLLRLGFGETHRLRR